MNAGALQPLVRQLITPAPYSPPTMKAAFFSEGITRTHRALFQRSSGMPLSGEFRSSVRTVADSFNRLTSSFERAANANTAVHRTTQQIATFFMEPPNLLSSPRSAENAKAKPNP